MTTATTNPESEPPPQDKIERAFELLAAAKKLESESDYWDATDKFVQAHKLLKVLAQEEHEKSTTAAVAENENETNASSEELENSRRIASLYESKAEEYWRKSRYCLIKAMEEEKIRDEQTRDNKNAIEETKERGDNTKNDMGKHNDENLPCACASLDEDQARARNRSFAVLFSRPLAAAETPPEHNHSSPAGIGAEPNAATHGDSSSNDGNNNDDVENIADEGDLEARLRALNQSLPSGFKTVNERMSDVHKGLGKLGMSSLYTQQHQPSSRLYEDELPKSEDEQIDEIMAQAQDEAMMEKMNNGENGENGALDSPGKTKTAANNDDQDSCFSDDDSESDDSENDELLDTDQLAMKTIQKQVVKAQVKLAELIALLDQAREKRAKEEMDEEEDVFKRDDDGADTDEDSFREVQKHDVAFLMMTGKKKLKSAQRDMKKALAEWEDLIL